ncbi:helix-turn-helix domain-containing protein [Methylomonas koyamae]|uniref:helix-turn-helix domain-containing protein n=1 Tax=Methylomonas koyamae TaxID=702114 RepID=UPI00112D9DED|nr:helix-turn-helix domain-containing protein [Methylomonas koyamae]TPQ24603.1 hypothetical protein C2U68_18945 [Methylomonas koyamae]
MPMLASRVTSPSNNLTDRLPPTVRLLIPLSQVFDFRPGDVRELENTLERSVLFCKSSELTRLELDQPASAAVGSDWNDRKHNLLKDAEQAFLQQALQSHHGNVKQVAEAMGITPRAVYAKLKKLDIKPGQFR